MSTIVIAIRFDTLGIFRPHIQAMELSSMVLWQPLLAAAMAAVIALRSWKKNSLSGSGAVTGFVLLALSLGAGPRLKSSSITLALILPLQHQSRCISCFLEFLGTKPLNPHLEYVRFFQLMGSNTQWVYKLWDIPMLNMECSNFYHPCSHFASPTSTNMLLFFVRVSKD